MVFLLKPLSFSVSSASKPCCSKRGEGLGDRAIELIEVLLAGQGLAELLEGGGFRLGLGPFSRPFPAATGTPSTADRSFRSAFPSW